MTPGEFLLKKRAALDEDIRSFPTSLPPDQAAAPFPLIQKRAIVDRLIGRGPYLGNNEFETVLMDVIRDAQPLGGVVLPGQAVAQFASQPLDEWMDCSS